MKQQTVGLSSSLAVVQAKPKLFTSVILSKYLEYYIYHTETL